MKRRNAYLVLMITALIAGGCGRDLIEPESVCTPHLALQAPPGILQDVATVTVRVTGPAMDTVTGNLSINGNRATGTIRVPAGENRTFTVEAKDSQNQVLATGNATRTLEAGTSPTITITLSIPSHDIVGYWGRSYSTGAEYLLFEADNTYEYEDRDDFGYLISFDFGTYSTSGDQLTMNSEGGFNWPTWTYSVTDGGNTLTLSSGGSSYVFGRLG